jgi:DNA-binding response OmpR family regulator
VIKESRNSKSSTANIIASGDKDRYWKRILIIDDSSDITTTFKIGIENNNINSDKKIDAHTYNDPRAVLLDFEPDVYDLLLIDINMPYINGFQLSERILEIDINVKICYMSSGEINRDALREVHPSISLGCFMRKPVSIDYFIGRVIAELE